LDILLVRYCSLPLENIKLNPVQQELIDSNIEHKNFKSKHRHKLVFYFTSNFTAFSNFNKKLTFSPREVFEAKALHFLQLEPKTVKLENDIQPMFKFS